MRSVGEATELLDLTLEGVRTVSIERIYDRELLRLDFPDGSPASTLWLRMKPDVAVYWSYGSTS